jgi:hypothetical protein
VLACVRLDFAHEGVVDRYRSRLAGLGASELDHAGLELRGSHLLGRMRSAAKGEHRTGEDLGEANP